MTDREIVFSNQTDGETEENLNDRIDDVQISVPQKLEEIQEYHEVKACVETGVELQTSNNIYNSGLPAGRNGQHEIVIEECQNAGNRRIDTIEEVTEENGSSAQIHLGSNDFASSRRKDTEVANANTSSEYTKSPRT